MAAAWRLAVIGCGNRACNVTLPYLQTIPHVELAAVCDQVPERAAAAAAQWHVPQWFSSVDALVQWGEFDIAANITSIPDHYGVNLKLLRAAKHLYSQKPLALTAAEGQHLISEARARGVKLSAASPSMLQPEIREAKRLVALGTIGKVSFARCISSHGGPEHHDRPDPFWFYGPGAGALRDMGVHGLHRITGILGPAKRVTAFSSVAERERVVRAGKAKGQIIRSQADDNTHVMLELRDGAFAVLDGTFCVKATKTPAMEIYGSEGTVSLGRNKELSLFLDDARSDLRGWMDPIYRWPKFIGEEGIGDLIEAIEQDTVPELSAEHAVHVVEIVEKAYRSAQEGQALALETAF